jgi:hypothetical protein
MTIIYSNILERIVGLMNYHACVRVCEMTKEMTGST